MLSSSSDAAGAQSGLIQVAMIILLFVIIGDNGKQILGLLDGLIVMIQAGGRTGATLIVMVGLVMRALEQTGIKQIPIAGILMESMQERQVLENIQSSRLQTVGLRCQHHGLQQIMDIGIHTTIGTLTKEGIGGGIKGCQVLLTL